MLKMSAPDFLSSANTPIEFSARVRLFEQADRRSLDGYLQGLVRDEERLIEVASRSSVHANGFMKIVLERKPGWALRLHVWKDAAAAERESHTENIHDHIWPFSSRILIGGLSEERFLKRENGEVAREYEYVRESRPFVMRGDLRFLGQAHLIRDSEIDHREGDVYNIDTEVLHRATGLVDQELNVTLALTGPIQKKYAKVYSLEGATAQSDPLDNRLSPDEVLVALNLITGAI
jgi:hypothetical protein